MYFSFLFKIFSQKGIYYFYFFSFLFTKFYTYIYLYKIKGKNCVITGDINIDLLGSAKKKKLYLDLLNKHGFLSIINDITKPNVDFTKNTLLCNGSMPTKLWHNYLGWPIQNNFIQYCHQTKSFY